MQERARTSRRRHVLVGAGAALLLTAGVVVGRLASPERLPEPPPSPTATAPSPVPASPAPEHYPFGPDSVWRQDVRDAPVAEDSPLLVGNLVEQVEDHWGGVAGFNAGEYSTSFYVVGPEQPRTDVRWDDCQGKGYTPRGLTGEGGQFTDVPVPDDARPAPGRDGQLTIYSPSTDQLWEFWRAERTSSGWQACWGGRIDDAATSPGYFEDGFGASATGLSLAGGMVWIDDVRAGRIDHAMALAIISPAHWKQVSWPAQRSDGSDRSEHAVPEGTRLRLDPSMDVEDLGLTPIGTLVARAAQTYGFIVVDKAATVTLSAQTGQRTAGDADPWEELLGGTPSYEVLAGFPWDRLQALPRDYGEPSPNPTASP